MESVFFWINFYQFFKDWENMSYSFRLCDSKSGT